MKKLYDNVYLASFGRKVIKLRFDLFDASLVLRLAQQTILTYFSSIQIRVWSGVPNGLGLLGLIRLTFVFSGKIMNQFIVEEHALGGDSPLQLLYEPRLLAFSRPSDRIGKWCINGVSFMVATYSLVFPQYGFLGWMFI